MMDPAEIERKLKELTPRQCQILYWVCQGGYDYVDIGIKLNFTEKTIQADMSKLYKAFGLTKKSMPEKRRILGAEVCPLHLARVTQPEIGCAQQAPVIDTEPVEPEVVEEVKKDAAGGFVPLERALVVVVQPDPEPPPPPLRGEIMPRPNYTFSGPERGEKTSPNPLLMVLVGVLGTLVVLLLVGLGFLVLRGSSPPSPTSVAGGAPTQPPIVITQPPIVITATPLAASVPAVTEPAVTNTPPPSQVTPSPVAATPSGPIIPAGESYSQNGVTVTLDKKISIYTDRIGFKLRITNQRPDDIVVLWRNSFVHLVDDQGRILRQGSQDRDVFQLNKQFVLGSGKTVEISRDPNVISCPCEDHPLRFDVFVGGIDPSAKYLIFTIDKIAGLTNLSWKFDLP